MSKEKITVSEDVKKREVKSYFVSIEQDKFTQLKTVTSKEIISIEGRSLDVLPGKTFWECSSLYKKILTLTLIQMQDDGEKFGTIFFCLIFQNTDGEYVGLENTQIFLILDDKKRIQLSGEPGTTGEQILPYSSNPLGVVRRTESATFDIATHDLTSLVNANKVEYRISFDNVKVEGTLSRNGLLNLQGFFNVAFDEDFELEKLYLCTFEEKREAEKREAEKREAVRNANPKSKPSSGKKPFVGYVLFIILVIVIVIGILIKISKTPINNSPSSDDTSDFNYTDKYSECKSFCADKFRECTLYHKDISPEDCANISNGCLKECKSRF